MPELLSAAELEALRKFDSPTISNAIETFGVRCHWDGFMGPQIVCRYPSAKELPMVGYAMTAVVGDLEPGDVGAADRRFGTLEAIKNAPNPTVLVYKDVCAKKGWGSHWGEVNASIMKRMGALGVITDGAVRDMDQVAEIGNFMFFSETVVVSHGAMTTVSWGHAVEVGGITVTPGDLIHADCNGVVVIPAEIAKGVARRAVEYVAMEEVWLKYLHGDQEIDLGKLREIMASAPRPWLK